VSITWAYNYIRSTIQMGNWVIRSAASFTDVINDVTGALDAQTRRELIAPLHRRLVLTAATGVCGHRNIAIRRQSPIPLTRGPWIGTPRSSSTVLHIVFVHW